MMTSVPTHCLKVQIFSSVLSKEVLNVHQVALLNVIMLMSRTKRVDCIRVRQKRRDCSGGTEGKQAVLRVKGRNSGLKEKPWILSSCHHLLRGLQTHTSSGELLSEDTVTRRGAKEQRVRGEGLREERGDTERGVRKNNRIEKVNKI